MWDGEGDNSCPFWHGNPHACGYSPLPLKPEETDSKGFAFPPQWEEEIMFLLIPS